MVIKECGSRQWLLERISVYRLQGKAVNPYFAAQILLASALRVFLSLAQRCFHRLRLPLKKRLHATNSWVINVVVTFGLLIVASPSLNTVVVS